MKNRDNEKKKKDKMKNKITSTITKTLSCSLLWFLYSEKQVNNKKDTKSVWDYVQ